MKNGCVVGIEDRLINHTSPTLLWMPCIFTLKSNVSSLWKDYTYVMTLYHIRSSKFSWLKIFVILADFRDSSLFRDFEVWSPVHKGGVRKFLWQKFLWFLCNSQKSQIFDYENLELYGIATKFYTMINLYIMPTIVLLFENHFLLFQDAGTNNQTALWLDWDWQAVVLHLAESVRWLVQHTIYEIGLLKIPSQISIQFARTRTMRILCVDVHCALKLSKITKQLWLAVRFKSVLHKATVLSLHLPSGFAYKLHAN